MFQVCVGAGHPIAVIRESELPTFSCQKSAAAWWWRASGLANDRRESLTSTPGISCRLGWRHGQQNEPPGRTGARHPDDQEGL